MIDHRELLIKYIQHVEQRSNEGVDYITQCGGNGTWFTPEEWAELEALALIAREEDK